MLDIQAFWQDVVSQNRAALSAYFTGDAVIRWPCTNERFTVDEYIRANCDYPGEWNGEIERQEALGSRIILVGRVCSVDRTASSHVVSFIETRDGRICGMDEYWADDGDAPAWRRAMNIGRPIR